MTASPGPVPESSAAAFSAGVSVSSLGDRTLSARFLAHIPLGWARRWVVAGLAPGDMADGVVDVAMSESHARSPTASETLDLLRRLLGVPVRPCIASEGEILRCLDRGYQAQADRTGQVIQKLDVSQAMDVDPRRTDLLTGEGNAPVVALVNSLLLEAVKTGASDLHIQPQEDGVAVRARLDGVLFDSHRLPRGVHEELVSRLKIMGGMDIAEHRLPQDGRASVEVGDRLVDLRLSSVPTALGERVVVRLLDKSASLQALPDLGMDPDLLAEFRRLIQHDHGLILVTGPTGSGKSTTLYAALRELHDRTGNIITLEDPIEYQLDGVSQIQVSDKKGMTFASGLRSVLRQDPDIIMVGEIRDRETAALAIQSAMTGHLVFSTLHTNDAPSAVARLLDLGIEPYLVASSVVGVMAQRLVRRVCPACAGAEPDPGHGLRALGGDVQTIHKMSRGAGCPLCRQTGYRGRVGLYELMRLSDTLGDRVQRKASAAELKALARKEGMRTLREDGLQKVIAGRTTADEVLRATLTE